MQELLAYNATTFTAAAEDYDEWSREVASRYHVSEESMQESYSKGAQPNFGIASTLRKFHYSPGLGERTSNGKCGQRSSR